MPSRGNSAGRAAALAAGCLFLVAGCGGDAPPLPDSRSDARAGAAAEVVGPEVPGDSEEFQQMEVPPGVLTRALPVGDAWSADDGPVYRSMCVRCHSVSQTAFATTDWQESLHARAGVTCAACHGSHEVGFVPRPEPERCAMCHSQEVEEFLASGHGPERAPGMRCVACHEAHATDRGLARSTSVCMGCHLDSEHVQGFPASRMGLVLAEHPPNADGSLRAADCAMCHAPDSAIMLETGDYRNDRVALHDPAITVGRDPKDPSVLTPETIDFLVPICTQCHSERNARHRLQNSDPLIRTWTPLGMTGEVRRRPVPEVKP